MREFHRYITTFDVSGIVKDDKETPLEIVWLGLKAYIKITQLWKLCYNIDSVTLNSIAYAIGYTNLQNIRLYQLFITSYRWEQT